MEQIAVFQKDAELESFVQCNHVVIYEKRENEWQVAKKCSYSPIHVESVATMHKEMKKLIQMVEGCKVVACKDIAGVPFSAFNAAGFFIFAIQDCSQETLDGIQKDIEEGDRKKQMHDEMMKNAKPVMTDTPGVYYLDFVQLQKECPEMTSKKALKPFLDTTPFLELKVICSHIPPWLEKDSRFELKSSAREDAVSILIRKKQCS